MRAMIDSLRIEIDSATNVLEAAENAGMEVSAPLAALIDAQNDLRKAAGLGPLPADLHLVRHDEPVGPAEDGD